MKAKTYNNLQIIGLMSGTSLDGLDIAHVSFDFSTENQIAFQILHSKTYPLPKDVFDTLFHIYNINAQKVFELDQQIAKFYAQSVLKFLSEFEIDKQEITAIASHGQTIFHQPQKGYTTQIGCGATLNYLTKIPVINQFRMLDVCAGGQGAPLVPIGDKYLFANLANGFLNLGGFANLSNITNNISTAFDIAPANLPMNRWMQSLGENFDHDGKLARSGTIDSQVYHKAIQLDYFLQKGPKSLGTEWLDQCYMPLFEHLSIPDRLRTHLEILSKLCCTQLQQLHINKVLVTGGGAHNGFLIEILQNLYSGELIVPDSTLINFKEALIFAFLGARYLRNETTTLKEVTGAREALRTGILHDYQGLLYKI